MNTFFSLPSTFVSRSGYATAAWLVGVVLSWGCASDELRTIPSTPLMCDDGTEADAEGNCPVPTGSIAGRLCNHALGEWFAAVDVSVDTPEGTLTVQTNEEGEFVLIDVPVGNYYVYRDGSPDNAVAAATVKADDVTTIGDTQCRPPPGSLSGRICDEEYGVWVGNATVTLNNEAGTNTTTDQFGNFVFLGVAPGTYVVTIESNTYSGTRTAEVYPFSNTHIGPSECVGHGGTITGRICGGDGYWLVNARVFVELPNGTVVETHTDADGFYTLTGVPEGTQTVEVTRGSFYTSFEVAVQADTVTDLPEPVCIPPTTRMAVVTGSYDKVQEVLQNLGFAVRHNYSSSGMTEHDPEGNIDIIAGVGTSFWVTDFMLDPLWMDEYDIIFFNCGISLGSFESGTNSSQAINNLKNFVAGGKSIYASDWAERIVQLAFPNRIAFQGRIGSSTSNLPTTAVDPGLVSALGRTNLVFNLNLGAWVVMSTQSAQPNDLRVLVRAPSTSGVTNSPIVVQFRYGQGRVLYTSAHNEAQTTPDLQDVLNYIIFEL